MKDLNYNEIERITNIVCDQLLKGEGKSGDERLSHITPKGFVKLVYVIVKEMKNERFKKDS